MGKTPLIIAPIIVAAALLWFAFWLGRKFERVAIVHHGKNIIPKTHTDMIEVLRDLLHPPDLNEVPYVPTALKERAMAAFAAANEQEQARIRAERRRLGW